MPVALIVLIIIAALGVRYWSGRLQRRALLNATLSDHERCVVLAQVPLLRMLPVNVRRKLEGKINLFLHQVEFHGCNGLEVDERMRLSIAAQACLLVVNNDQWYKSLQTILIYPGAFKSLRREYDGYVVSELETIRTGESWQYGPVILSWQHSTQGAANHVDGKNVVFHEFAHQIDALSGNTDGVPLLGRQKTYDDWGRAFIPAFQRHVAHVENHHGTIIDPYGAEGLQEFFAVAVEAFFEKPKALHHAEPAVYRQLARFFRLEPLSWS